MAKCFPNHNTFFLDTENHYEFHELYLHLCGYALNFSVNFGHYRNFQRELFHSKRVNMNIRISQGGQMKSKSQPQQTWWNFFRESFIGDLLTNPRQELKSWGKCLAIFLFLKAYVVSAYVIDGSCMEPQLSTSDRVVVNKILYQFRPPKLDEIVVFPFPKNPAKDFVKRVVGMPGDLIEIRDGRLWRNGKAIRESFVREPIWGHYGPRRVPKNSLFVMGDNRNNSLDSRYWGFVEIPKIAGRIELRYWPLNKLGYLGR